MNPRPFPPLQATMLLALVAFIGPALALEDIITSVAGGYPREDSPSAALTGLNSPEGVFAESGGTLVYSDTLNNRVRRYNPSTSTVTTLAGSGFSGAFGEGGPALTAWLNQPSQVWVDSAGNIYIADSGNNRICKVTAATGILSVIAGNGQAGSAGDGAAATSAQLNSPTGVAVDSAGNVYIADRNNNRVRRVDSTGTISTFAGGGGALGDGGPATSAQLNNPRALFIDSSNGLYIADTGQNRIRFVNSTTNNISTVAGNGTAGFAGDGAAATAAQINSPRGVWVNSGGDIFIGDRSNQRIRKVTLATGFISTIAGTGVAGFAGDGAAATAGQLNNPNGVAVDSSGQVYIADRTNNRVRRIDGSANINTVLGTASPPTNDGLHALFGNLTTPQGIAVDGSGNLFIADASQHRVRRVDATTRTITTIAGTGTAGFAGDGGAATAAQLDTPTSVSFDAAGNLYISDSQNDCVRRVDTAGIITSFAGTTVAGFTGDGGAASAARLNNPTYVFAGTGGVYIADTNNNRIRRVDSGNLISTVAGGGAGAPALGDGGAATNAGLSGPRGVCVSSAGVLFIADTGNQRIRKVDAGTISTVAGNGVAGYSGDGDLGTAASLNSPRGLALDSAGNLLCCDLGNARLRKLYLANGKITTIAGGGPSVFQYGDGGPAILANLLAPVQPALASDGSILIADSGHGLIRRIASGSNRPPVFTALANASPTPCVTGQVVVFDVQAEDPDGDVVSYNWTFGDGTAGYGAFTTHVYTSPGLYFAKVIASDGDGTTDSSGMTIVVNTTAPADSASFLVSGASFRFNYTTALKDIVALKGSVPVPSGFAPDGLPVEVRIGNLSRSFTLNAKGSGVHATDPKNNLLRLTGQAPLLKFSFSVKKQTLLSELVDLGFTSETVLKPGTTLTIPVAISVNGIGYLTSINVVFLSTAGRGGAARYVKP